MNVHGRTPANSSAIGRNERVSREGGRERLRLLKALVQKSLGGGGGGEETGGEAAEEEAG